MTFDEFFMFEYIRFSTEIIALHPHKSISPRSTNPVDTMRDGLLKASAIGALYSYCQLKVYITELLTDFSLFGGAESAAPSSTTTKSPSAPSPSFLTRTKIPNTQLNVVHESTVRTPQDPNDFLWLMTEEPHRSRRRAILRAHPEVSLFRL